MKPYENVGYGRRPINPIYVGTYPVLTLRLFASPCKELSKSIMKDNCKMLTNKSDNDFI